MKIEVKMPPQWLWDECHKQFQIDDERTIYTYGDTIFNPADVSLTTEIIAHEETHMHQQAGMEGGSDAWWKKYFADTEFRKAQEMPAYGNQYRLFCKTHRDRNEQARYLMKLADIACSPMYKMGIGLFEANRLIKDSPKI